MASFILRTRILKGKYIADYKYTPQAHVQENININPLPVWIHEYTGHLEQIPWTYSNTRDSGKTVAETDPVVI